MRLRPRSRTFNSRRRLNLEALEPRQMLSATVTAVLSAGNLTLTGNKNAAYVEVHETATTGTFLITGLSGTKISYNGATGTSESVSGVTGSLTVNLPGSGSGTQSFELDSLSLATETDIIGNLSITMGNANNTVTLQGPGLGVGGNASITTGSGNQTISVGKVEDIGDGFDFFVNGGPMSITTGAGNSTVSVYDTGIYEGSLSITLGNGNGKVTVGSESDPDGDIFVGDNLCVDLGNGNGTVGVFNSDIDNNLVVQTGSGNQNITIGAEHPEEFLDQSVHPDEIPFSDYDVTVGGYIYVGDCPGNTNVTIFDTTTESFEESEVVHPAFISQSSLDPGDVAIELASGNDNVTIGSSISEVNTDVSISGNLYIDTGTGNTSDYIKCTTVDGNTEISHQAGNTSITIGAYDQYLYEEESDVVFEGSLCITTSTGNATIALGGTAEGDSVFVGCTTKITTGAGTNSISLTDDEFDGNVSITTGTGNSTINILDDDFFSNLGVTLGVGGTSGGNSSVTIRDTFVEGSTTLAGGGNASLYYDGTDDFAGGLSYSHFKKVTT